MINPSILIPKTRTLFHFTAARFVEPIKVEGLTKGTLPWHRCPFTGEALCLRHWAEKTATAGQIQKLRGLEVNLERQARRGDAAARVLQRKYFPGFQWLTVSPSFNQPFALLGDLPIAKNASRITISIPEAASLALHKWPELVERHNPPSAEELNTPQVDWSNWYVFNGWIPPSWIVAVERNPGERFAGGTRDALG